MHSEGIYTWYTYLTDILTELDINPEIITTVQNTGTAINNIKKQIKSNCNVFFNNLLGRKIEDLNESNKIFLYKNIKINLKQEFYLKHNHSDSRKLLTKFRISEHTLLIEKGRHLKIPRDQRYCKFCNEIEDEKHFFLKCPKYNFYRNKYFDSMKINSEWKDTAKDDMLKLKILLNPTSHSQIKNTVSFIKQSLELRTGDPKQ